MFATAYQAARLLAAKETGIAWALLPEQSPFTLQQTLDPDVLPEEPEGL